MIEDNIFDTDKFKKRSKYLFNEIKEKIFKGEFLSGERLLSERELSRRFMVSRVTVREALKELVTSGFLDVKRGVKGGYFVVDEIRESIRESLYDLARLGRLPLNDIVEARIILEPDIIKLAYERATKEDLLRMDKEIKEHEKIIESDEPEIYKARRGLIFHRIIGESINNSVLELAINYIIDLHNIIMPDLRYSYQFFKILLKEHIDIYIAIKERDSNKASILMINHLKNALINAENINYQPNKEKEVV